MTPTDVFISYASADLARAEALAGRLKTSGFDVWFDKDRLDPGCRWHEVIEAGCEATRVMLPLITPRWRGSLWTRYETYGHRTVIPILAEGNPADTLTPPLRGANGITLDPLTADDATWDRLIAAIRDRLAEPPPERAPRVAHLPYPPTEYFTGRDDDIVRLHEALWEAPVATLTQGHARAIAAMGGVGKTTLANMYARLYWRLYDQILWVDARVGVAAGHAALHPILFPGRDSAGRPTDELAAEVLAELSRAVRRLLVLDNVADEASVRPWLRRDATTGCRTLITSRFADWPAGTRVLSLDVWDPPSARHFLLARTGRAAADHDLGVVDDLACELGYLPLALEQAAAFMVAPGAECGFAQYLDWYRARTADLLARGVLGSTEYPDSVLTTWRITRDRLSADSRAVLRLCAWYADTPIPRALVMDGAADILPLAAAFGAADPVSPPDSLRMRDALAGLGRYSMILDATEDGFRVHGLVQTAERIEAERDGAAEAARLAALTRLSAVFPYAFNEPGLWPLCRRLPPHQSAVTAGPLPDHAIGPLGLLLNNAASFLQGSGDAAAVLPLVRHTLAARERVLGPEHPDTLSSMNNLASCLEALGDAAAALPLYRHALGAQERVLGPEHPDTLISVNNLAGCLETLGHAAAALPLYQRALAARERVLGPEHPATLTSVNNLAFCLRALGDAAAALPLHRRALRAQARVLGPEHLATLISVNNLALCLETLGDASAALPLHQRVLAARERVLGIDHPATLSSVDNLAGCLETLGDSAAALPLYQRAFTTIARRLGPDHPTTRRIQRNYEACRAAVEGGGAPPHS